ncbi:hypothetical protein KFK09_008568 [Dendrobium nobile]|uniref:Uncharacterized protein n=1 Tax=Dendrobium nobile TaxID=94219 RepID=A0A8T3BQB0_DENNO|nr:hypothetical protein KFK09_008568 [Dendrobium nobile]
MRFLQSNRNQRQRIEVTLTKIRCQEPESHQLYSSSQIYRFATSNRTTALLKAKQKVGNTSSSPQLFFHQNRSLYVGPLIYSKLDICTGFVVCRDLSEKENDNIDYKIVGNGSADIIHEIEKLKLDKKGIENRISKLEAQLKADEAVQMKANQACSSYDSILDGHAVSSNGLTPGMIYRYSRHFLLPDFGVEYVGFLEIFCSSV